MKQLLQEQHARLLAMKPEFLNGWKQEFNSYEVFAEKLDPFGPIYTSIIDACIASVAVDYDQLVVASEDAIKSSAANKWHDLPVVDRKGREAQCAEFMRLSCVQVDSWCNEYLAKVLLGCSDAMQQA